MAMGKMTLVARAGQRSKGQSRAVVYSKPKAPLRTKVRKVIERMSEKKYYQTSGVPTINQTWITPVAIMAPSQADTDTGRTGDMINQKKLNIRFGIEGPSGADVFLRIIIFRWKSDGDPSASDIVTTSAGAYAYLSPRLHDNRSLMTVLHDKIYNLNDGKGKNQIARIVKDLKGVKQRFFAGGSTNVKNGLYFTAVNSDNTNTTTLRYYLHNEFYDL